MQKKSAMRLIIGVAAGAVLLMGSVPAAASCTPNTDTGVTVDAFRSNVQPPIKGNHWQAQTFTVTGSGCFLLDKVTFSVAKFGSPGNLIVEIYNVASADTPAFPAGLGGSETPLASAAVLASSVSTSYTDITVTFSSPPQISGGSQYALVIHQVGGSGQDFYQFGLAAGALPRGPSPYGGGRYCRSTGSGWECPPGPNGGMDVRMSICVSACGSGSGCTLTQGFWKTHGGTGPQPDAWPVSSLSLGTVSYTKSELLAILNQQVGGKGVGANGLISLAHQLIAAKLNIANGASAPSGVQSAINSADFLIDGSVVPPVGSGFLPTSATSSLTATLDQYNQGSFPGGPPHCP